MGVPASSSPTTSETPLAVGRLPSAVVVVVTVTESAVTTPPRRERLLSLLVATDFTVAPAVSVRASLTIASSSAATARSRPVIAAPSDSSGSTGSSGSGFSGVSGGCGPSPPWSSLPVETSQSLDQPTVDCTPSPSALVSIKEPGTGSSDCRLGSPGVWEFTWTGYPSLPSSGGRPSISMNVLKPWPIGSPGHSQLATPLPVGPLAASTFV
jgi:hypothetical protein